MINVFSAVFFLYVFLRLVLPLPLAPHFKAALGLALLLAAAKFFFFSYLSGSLASPEAPRPLQLLGNWLFIALVLLFLLVLAKDVVLSLIWLGNKLFSLPRPGPGTRLPIAIALSTAALLLSGIGVWQAVKAPVVRNLEITLSKLALELDGLTLVQLTDIHSSRLLPRARTESVVAAVNALKPDLILVTGDLVDGTVADRAEDVAPLKDLEAAHGIYYCVGNHEYYSGFSDWRAAFERLGLKLLYNNNALLEIKGGHLLLAGLADPVGAGPRFNLEAPDLRAALGRVPEGVPVILLDHRPGSAQASATAGVDVQLSGHTHGGLMWGFDRLVARFNEGYVRGLYQVDKMKLYVSPGTGLWSGFPVRLGTSGEITRIVLRSGQPPKAQNQSQ